MANNIKLEVYTFGFRNPRESDYLNLGDIQGTTFKDAWKEFLKSVGIRKKDDNLKKTLKINLDDVSDDDDFISGIFESGEYGYASDIVDVDDEDGAEPVFKKKNNHAEVLPFYFLIYTPNNKNKAIVLLQRFGAKGINTVLGKNFKEFSKIKFPEKVVDLLPFVSKALANHWIENGGISEFSFISHQLPSDKSDKLGLAGYEKEVKSVKLEIKAKGIFGVYLNKKVKKFIDNPNAVFFDVKGLDDYGLNAENSKRKIKLTMNGSTRTIDLSETGKIRPYYDVDNEVEKNSNGHPDFKSIDKIAKKLLTDLLNIDKN